MFYSKPGTVFFINRIISWMKRQNERLWCAKPKACVAFCMVPFWDSAGVAMINECKAKDLRIICRPGAVAKYLKKGVQVRVDKDGHSKVIVGDTATLLGKFDTATPAEGSFNMSYQSMYDNQENATYSRSKDYADFFLAKWEEAVVPGEHEGER